MCTDRLISGCNDLATVYPDLAMEWNYEKNGVITPRQIGFASKKQWWWKDFSGNVFRASIGERLNKAKKQSRFR